MNTTAIQSKIRKLLPIGILYFLAHIISFLFPDKDTLIMAIWPAGGIGLATLLLNEKKLWPSIIGVLFVSGMFADIFIAHRPALLSLGFMAANILESLLCAWFILKFSPDFKKFTGIKEVFSLLFSVVLINAVTSCIGAGTAVINSGSSFFDAWSRWYIADGLGLFMVGPLVVLWVYDFKNTIDHFRSKISVEILFAFILWSIVCYLSFNNASINGNIVVHPYMIVAFLMGLAVRFRMQGVTLFILILFIIAIFSNSMVSGLNPMTGDVDNFSAKLVELQIFLFVVLIVGYITSTAFTALSITESELKNSKSSLQAVQRVGNVGHWTWDINENNLEWSDEMFVIFGIDRNTFIGSLGDVLAKAIHPEDLSAVDKSNISVIQNAKPIPLEYRIIWPDGTIRNVWAEAVELKLDDKGKAIKLSGIVQDITDRKKAEAKLKLSEERLGSATFAAKIGVWDWDIKMNTLWWDDSMYQLYGINKNNFPGVYDAWVNCIHPDDKDRIDAEIQLALNGVKEYAPEFRVILPDNSIRFIKADSKTFMDEMGKPVRMLGTNRDITDRKQTEHELRESEERFSNIFYSNPIAQSIISLVDGKILAVNEACCKMFGYEKDELINMMPSDLFLWNDNTDRERALRELKDKGSLRNIEEAARTKNGEVKIVLLSVVPIFWKDIPCTINSTVDITERKNSEVELNSYKNNLENIVEQRTKELETVNLELIAQIVQKHETEVLLAESLEKEKGLNQLKSRFLTTASHEFKTPLTTVLSSAELLQRYAEKWSPDKIHSHVERIKNSVEHLSKLVDDVLLFNRTETGKTVVKLEMVDMHELCLSLINDMKLNAQESHSFNFNYTSEKRVFYFDPKQMYLAIQNLLANAMKYSPNGGKIELNVSSDGADLILSVSDEGIGIAKDDINKLFEPFYRGSNCETIPGTGLGLSLLRQAIELHNGKISVDSELGKGTTFTIIIPDSLLVN